MDQEGPSATLGDLPVPDNSSAEEKAGPPAFTYQPLDESEDCIRLLALGPASIRNRTGLEYIDCKLMHVSFRERPKYEALSYRWGTENASEIILLDGHAFKFRKNLFQALSHFQKANEWRNLWVDAICIDQNNLEERKRQVGLMNFIYTRASCVLVWLGATPELPGHRDVIWDFPRIIRENFSTNAEWAKYPKDLDWVSGNEYWNRVWIIQEVGLARRLTGCTNTWQLCWDEFFSTLQVVNNYFSTNPKLNASLRNFELIKKLDEKRRDRHGASNHLQFLLEDFQDAQCQDPRDKIFGFLGLAHDCDDGSIEVDYSKPLFDLYSEVMNFLCAQFRWGDDGMEVCYNPTETIYLSQLVQRLLSFPKGSPPSFCQTRAFIAVGAYGGRILQLGPTDIELSSSSAAYKDWRRAFEDSYYSGDDIKKLREVNEAYDDLLFHKGELVRSKVRSIDHEEYLSNEFVTNVEFEALTKNTDFSEIKSALEWRSFSMLLQQCPPKSISSHPAQPPLPPRIMLCENLLLGLAPPEARIGDLICQFWETDVVAILRQCHPGEGYQVVGRVDLSAGCLKDGNIVYKKWVAPPVNAFAIRIYMDIMTLSKLTSDV
ncbi:Heterokaryon incompatibility protein (HET) domain containing protein [Hyaloscypha variabilis]